MSTQRRDRSTDQRAGIAMLTGAVLVFLSIGFVVVVVVTSSAWIRTHLIAIPIGMFVSSLLVGLGVYVIALRAEKKQERQGSTENGEQDQTQHPSPTVGEPGDEAHKRPQGDIVSEERDQDSQGSTATSTPSSAAPQTKIPPDGQTSPPEDEKSSPYNLWFAWSVLGVAVVAYVVTILLFRGLFEDPAVVTGALGALFTLIGTVAGAYFGVKSSSDTADRAKKQVDEASARTERANRSAKAALLEVDPNKSQEIRDRGLL